MEKFVILEGMDQKISKKWGLIFVDLNIIDKFISLAADLLILNRYLLVSLFRFDLINLYHTVILELPNFCGNENFS